MRTAARTSASTWARAAVSASCNATYAENALSSSLREAGCGSHGTEASVCWLQNIMSLLTSEVRSTNRSPPLVVGWMDVRCSTFLRPRRIGSCCGSCLNGGGGWLLAAFSALGFLDVMMMDADISGPPGRRSLVPTVAVTGTGNRHIYTVQL